MRNKYLSVKEFAALYQVSIAWVYLYIRKGEIPVVSLPGNLKKIDLEVWKNREKGLPAKKSSVSLKTEYKLVRRKNLAPTKIKPVNATGIGELNWID